ncbi:MAG: hypothetical protein ACR2P2_18815 [Nakamurella sp.]
MFHRQKTQQDSVEYVGGATSGGRSWKRAAVVAAIATGALGVGMAVAVAGSPSTTTSGSDSLNTHEATFSGSWVFYATTVNHGGYGYPGKVCDHYNNGYAVFVHAKTEGYGYGSKTYAGPSVACTSENQYVYDYQGTYVSYGNTEVCVDRGALLSNYCASHDHYR